VAQHKKLEQEIQTKVTDAAKGLKLVPIRLNVTGRKGWPDYGYLYAGRIAFIEFKRPGEKPEPLQLYVHELLNVAGFEVFVVDNEDYGITLLMGWKHGIDRELERLRQSNGGNARPGPHV